MEAVNSILGRTPPGPVLPPPASRRGEPQDPIALHDAARGFFDLSAPSRRLHVLFDQSPGFQESFLKQLARLLAQGIVGTETVVQGAEFRERFLEAAIGDHAPAARRLDVRT